MVKFHKNYLKNRLAREDLCKRLIPMIKSRDDFDFELAIGYLKSIHRSDASKIIGMMFEDRDILYSSRGYSLSRFQKTIGKIPRLARRRSTYRISMV